MGFYLPITVNQRRLHVCHLQEQKKDVELKPIFNFIINKDGNNLNVFSIDTDEAKLISTEGWSNDRLLKNYDTKVEYQEKVFGELPAFYVDITEEQQEKKNKSAKGLVINGNFSNSDNLFRTEIDKTVINQDSFVVVIRYEKFSYAFKIHLCEKNSLIETAIDFGSEASQISDKGAGNNMKLVEEFRKFHTRYSHKEDFWQGKLKDQLYKSVFFLHLKPGNTQYAEKPNKNNDSTLVQTLLPYDLEREKYNDLVILPNLKLMELIDKSYWNDEIVGGHPFSNAEAVPLSSEKAIAGTLRLILSNFLYCILAKKREDNCTYKRYLRLVLLMPNVYYQKKIYTIIRDLYEDFETITTSSTMYSQYAGIEIQIISESDAAFLGLRKDNDIKKQINAKGGHFLIIDAGKGTTDFSILKQYDTHSKFDSIYRAGIPASGHILTYAFYEALRDFLNKKGYTLNDKLQIADRATLLKFMEAIETFKINYNKYSFDSEALTEGADFSSLDAINTFLGTLITTKEHIPNVKQKIEEKVAKLVTEIKKSIKESGVAKFEQVLLTGRGFLFTPFCDQIKEMIKDENWIVNMNDIFSYDSDKAKTICLTGAFSIAGDTQINMNSELIGRPIITRVSDRNDGRLIKLYLRIKQLVNRRKVSLDSEFFYGGKTGINYTNISVKIGGREIRKHIEDSNEKRFYFTGEGFIFQLKNEVISFDENSQLGADIDELVKQTLFPYYTGSIPEKEVIKKYPNKPNPPEDAKGKKDKIDDDIDA